MSGAAVPSTQVPAERWVFPCRNAAGDVVELTLINSRVSVILSGPFGSLALDRQSAQGFLIRLAREIGTLPNHGERG
ncbi:hypothetical protein AB0A74_07150 [Saccharothrix sp. NPDC042600]|uniref:hypothetical protein n=1 Tax=Saccharothrix TaxID=2071 RepID=UPI0033EF0C2D|nr:hypothetical protein GCM10017745_30480 [Saccharothrix mutabilis subsp. capreolus]